MSDPKLREILARAIRDAQRNPATRDPEVYARVLIENHRLVQLPEEPSGWTDRGWASCFGDPDTPSIQVYRERRSWMDPLPIYILHGDPKEVDDG